MKRFNGIAVIPVRSLEIGDLIAFEVAGTVVSGRVTGKVSYPSQLTIEQEKYMRKHGLDIPENEYESLAGHQSCLLFGEFVGTAILDKDQPNHGYVGLDMNVAVFLEKEQ